MHLHMCLYHICADTLIYAYILIFTWIHTYICAYLRTCIHTCILAHIHTCIFTQFIHTYCSRNFFFVSQVTACQICKIALFQGFCAGYSEMCPINSHFHTYIYAYIHVPIYSHAQIISSWTVYPQMSSSRPLQPLLKRIEIEIDPFYWPRQLCWKPVLVRKVSALTMDIIEGLRIQCFPNASASNLDAGAGRNPFPNPCVPLTIDIMFSDAMPASAKQHISSGIWRTVSR